MSTRTRLPRLRHGCVLVLPTVHRGAAAASHGHRLEVSHQPHRGVDPARGELQLQLRGSGTRARNSPSGLVAHLNIVGLSSGIYVDPEDWSEERTKFVPPLAPGESTESRGR